MGYTHTQRGHLHWLLWGTAALLAVIVALAPMDPVWLRGLLGAVVILVVLLGFCFHTLTVMDAGDALSIRYGPIGLFRKRVPYASMRAVVPARSAWIDGWGVHWLPGRGWTWNLWGRDCVEITLDVGRLRVGTDDRAALVAFLQTRIEGAAA